MYPCSLGLVVAAINRLTGIHNRNQISGRWSLCWRIAGQKGSDAASMPSDIEIQGRIGSLSSGGRVGNGTEQFFSFEGYSNDQDSV